MKKEEVDVKSVANHVIDEGDEWQSPRRLWATWEDLLIRKERAKGTPVSEISQVIDRSARSIYNRTPSDLREPNDEIDQYILDNCRDIASVIALKADVSCKEVEDRSERMGVVYTKLEEDPLSDRCNLDDDTRLRVLESQEDYAKACGGDEFCYCELCDARMKLDAVWDSGENGKEYYKLAKKYTKGGREYERLLNTKKRSKKKGRAD